MKKTAPIRWGMIGCGNVTELKSAPAYQQTDGFELVSVMGRNEEKVRDYASRHDIENFYTDADALISASEVDAVYIATPPDSHLHYALKVAEAGKPCCIEKPLAPSFAACKSICEAFEEKKLPLFVAYYRRSLSHFLQIKEWLDLECIGTVRQVSWHLAKPPKPIDLLDRYNWRTDVTIAPGGYFDDLACHGLDLIAFLLGDFKKVSGVSQNQQGFYPAKDAFVAHWLHESGVTGVGSWNFGCGLLQDRLEIVGSKGRIECAVFEEKPIRLVTKSIQKEVQIPHPKHIQAPHVLQMRNTLLRGKDHPSTGRTATHTTWIMDQILGG